MEAKDMADGGDPGLFALDPSGQFALDPTGGGGIDPSSFTGDTGLGVIPTGTPGIGGDNPIADATFPTDTFGQVPAAPAPANSGITGDIYTDPQTGLVVDLTTGTVYDPSAGWSVVATSNSPAMPQPPPGFVLGQEGYYYDPKTGLAVDRVTGAVYDTNNGWAQQSTGNDVVPTPGSTPVSQGLSSLKSATSSGGGGSSGGGSGASLGGSTAKPATGTTATGTPITTAAAASSTNTMMVVLLALVAGFLVARKG